MRARRALAKRNTAEIGEMGHRNSMPMTPCPPWDCYAFRMGTFPDVQLVWMFVAFLARHGRRRWTLLPRRGAMMGRPVPRRDISIAAIVLKFATLDPVSADRHEVDQLLRRRWIARDPVATIGRRRGRMVAVRSIHVFAELYQVRSPRAGMTTRMPHRDRAIRTS
jgi:hypothetical protein